MRFYNFVVHLLCYTTKFIMVLKVQHSNVLMQLFYLSFYDRSHEMLLFYVCFQERTFLTVTERNELFIHICVFLYICVFGKRTFKFCLKIYSETFTVKTQQRYNSNIRLNCWKVTKTFIRCVFQKDSSYLLQEIKR